MFGEVRNVLHKNLDEMSDKMADASKSAKKHAMAASSAAVVLAQAGRSVRDAEIANHYNRSYKYGLAGSDGSFWSNYYRHTMNNHEVLSLFFADKRNPFNKRRRWIVLFNKLSLSLCLAAAFSTIHNDSNVSISVSTPLTVKFGYSLIISLILCPYGYVLKHIASCTVCTRMNCCVKAVSSLGFCTLVILALISVIFLTVGIVLAVEVLNTTVFIEVFIYSTLLDYASYFYYGIWNWYLLSWEGFLVIPVFPHCGNEGFPGRFYPIYTFWPLKKFLQAYGLCTSTYVQDKKEFQEKFPNRVSIDDVSEQSARSDYDEQETSHISHLSC